MQHGSLQQCSGSVSAMFHQDYRGAGSRHLAKSRLEATLTVLWPTSEALIGPICHTPPKATRDSKGRDIRTSIARFTCAWRDSSCAFFVSSCAFFHSASASCTMCAKQRPSAYWILECSHSTELRSCFAPRRLLWHPRDSNFIEANSAIKLTGCTHGTGLRLLALSVGVLCHGKS